ncbi:hypothetical protein AAE478_009037 [Parahypoxylon ruwenzoriense]
MIRAAALAITTKKRGTGTAPSMTARAYHGIRCRSVQPYAFVTFPAEDRRHLGFLVLLLQPRARRRGDGAGALAAIAEHGSGLPESELAAPVSGADACIPN